MSAFLVTVGAVIDRPAEFGHAVSLDRAKVPLLAPPPRSASALARSVKRRRGGCVIKKISRSLRSRRSRGGFPFSIHRNTTPASRTADASRYFLDRSATPPRGYARRGIRSSGTILTFRVQRLCCEEVRNSERKSDSVAPGGKMSKL